jgi:hypothetical protein
MWIVTSVRLTCLLLTLADHRVKFMDRMSIAHGIGFQGMPIESSMRQRYENDDRLYSHSKAHPRSRYFVQCLAEQAYGDEPPWHCRFAEPEDDFRNNVHRNIFHKCRCMPPSGIQGGQRRLEDVTPKRASQKSHLLPDIALFLAMATVSVSAVYDSSFRSLLR